MLISQISIDIVSFHFDLFPNTHYMALSQNGLSMVFYSTWYSKIMKTQISHNNSAAKNPKPSSTHKSPKLISLITLIDRLIVGVSQKMKYNCQHFTVHPPMS